MKVPTGLSIEKKTLDQIDSRRGQIPRSRILEELINKGLSLEKLGVES
jgi:hypothetical protein